MKGFVFIFGSEIRLRFLDQDAFKALEARHELTYVLLRSGELMNPDSLNGALAAGRRKIAWVLFYPERDRRWHDLFDLSCLRYQDRSPSFAVRVQEQTREDPARFARLSRLATPERYESYRDAVEARLGLHPDLLALTVREQPDFFVLPSKLLDYFTDDVLQLAAQFKIPTLLLTAGWDNLSSKGLLPPRRHPTMIGCWGSQSVRHAVAVQRVEPDRLALVGAPHYERFRRPAAVDRAAIRSSLGVPLEGPVVLFAGSLRPFDETRLLHDMERAIDAGTLPAMHVLYRPHPWRGARRHEANFFASTWRHVTLDPQVASTYRATKEQGKRISPDNFLFDMDHLYDVYRAVDAVISPMSTVLLEALLAGMPAMAVAFGDGKHSWSPDKVSRMLHFEEVYRLPNLIVCRERAHVFPSVQQLLAQIGDEALAAARRTPLQDLVYHDARTYAERVADLIDTMLTGAAGPPDYAAPAKPGRRFRVQAAWRRSVVRRGCRRVARSMKLLAAE